MTVIGEVRAGEAFIPLTLTGLARSLTIEAIVDTGFNGSLVLPPELMTEFGHGLGEFAESTLADGRTATYRVMTIHLQIGNQVESVDAIEMGSEPLLGMALLAGRRLTIDVTEGGSVVIDPLAPQLET